MLRRLQLAWLRSSLSETSCSSISSRLVKSKLMCASWIVARTNRLRVGTAVQLLPLNHPLRVAGEVATLDHLSKGRFDFGMTTPSIAILQSIKGLPTVGLACCAYDATMGVWGHVDWMQGIFWSPWYSAPNAGGPNDIGESPQNKPAEQLLHRLTKLACALLQRLLKDSELG